MNYDMINKTFSNCDTVSFNNKLYIETIAHTSCIRGVEMIVYMVGPKSWLFLICSARCTQWSKLHQFCAPREKANFYFYPI